MWSKSNSQGIPKLKLYVLLYEWIEHGVKFKDLTSFNYFIKYI